MKIFLFNRYRCEEDMSLDYKGVFRLYVFYSQIVLLLLLCEAMVSKHVPLNQNPEYDAHREASFIKLKPLFMYIDAVYSVQCTVCIVHCTLYMVHGTLYILHCTLYSRLQLILCLLPLILCLVSCHSPYTPSLQATSPATPPSLSTPSFLATPPDTPSSFATHTDTHSFFATHPA